MSVFQEKPVAEGGGQVRRRRRRWSEAQERQIVAETHEPGVSVPMVAQRYNLNANQVFHDCSSPCGVGKYTHVSAGVPSQKFSHCWLGTCSLRPLALSPSCPDLVRASLAASSVGGWTAACMAGYPELSPGTSGHDVARPDARGARCGDIAKWHTNFGNGTLDCRAVPIERTMRDADGGGDARERGARGAALGVG